MYLKKNKTVWLLYDSMPPCKSGQVLPFSRCRSTACCSTRLPPQKSYYISHIQVWTQNDGQSSLWSWGASKVSPTFSKKSVIHSVVEVLFLHISFLAWFTLYIYCVLFYPVFFLSGACSLHTIQFLRYYHRITNKGKPCFETMLSCDYTDLLFFVTAFENIPINFLFRNPLFIMFFSII